MAYKPESTFGLGFSVEIFDPDMEGKYIGRYKKVNKRKDGVGYSPGWLIWPTVNGKRYHEFYMDKLYNDSPAESLVAAIKRRNEVLSWRDENPIPFNESLISSNVSGRNGVSLQRHATRRESRVSRLSIRVHVGVLHGQM